MEIIFNFVKLIHPKIGTISQNIKAWISFGSKISLMKKSFTRTAVYLLSK